MKSPNSNQHGRIVTAALLPAILVAVLVTLGAGSPAKASGNGGNSGVLPPHAHPYGKSYGEWSASWWQWFMEHPVAGHPGVDSLDFDVSSGQDGNVWFLGSPFGTVEREVTIPAGKALFIGLLNAEASDTEYGTLTEEDQRALAEWLVDHVASVSCSVDGKPVQNIERHRLQSPQFSFTAPDPWIFSPAPSGPGTAVSDGYFVMLAPLSAGEHTIQIAGSFYFAAGELGPDPVEFGLDVTYRVTVSPQGSN